MSTAKEVYKQLVSDGGRHGERLKIASEESAAEFRARQHAHYAAVEEARARKRDARDARKLAAERAKKDRKKAERAARKEQRAAAKAARKAAKEAGRGKTISTGNRYYYNGRYYDADALANQDDSSDSSSSSSSSSSSDSSDRRVVVDLGRVQRTFLPFGAKETTTDEAATATTTKSAGHVEASGGSEAVSQALYDIVNGPRDEMAAGKITPALYGDVRMLSGDIDVHGRRTPLLWHFDYAQTLKIDGKFHHEHSSGGGTSEAASSRGHLAYAVFEPANWPARRKLATIVLTHGVPVNKAEWYPVARLLGRFMRVVCVDLLGMGESAKPLDFGRRPCDGSSIVEWHWTFQMHAHLFRAFFEAHPEWLVGRRLFFGANDWGAGVLDAYLDHYAADSMLHGALSVSAVTLNLYWVMEIGSMAALANAPYESAAERAAFHAGPATAFLGTLTRQLNQMYRDPTRVHSQSSMQWLQQPYVDTYAYDDPSASPATMLVRSHNIRVLAQQAAHLLGRGQLLPASRENPGGLRIDRWTVPLLKVHGKRDDMMPESSVNVWCELARLVRAAGGADSFRVTPYWLENAEHFASSDAPERFAEVALNWMRDTLPTGQLNTFASALLGFDTIARRDEVNKLALLNKQFDIALSLNPLVVRPPLSPLTDDQLGGFGSERPQDAFLQPHRRSIARRQLPPLSPLPDDF